MKKVFVSYSFSQKGDFVPFHDQLKKFLNEKYSLEVYAFVFDFTDKVDDKELMNRALAQIDEADLVMVELSNKSIGVGIEAGYAKAKGKPIIYLHQEGTEIKQAMNGIAELVITYQSVEDLIKQISNLEILRG